MPAEHISSLPILTDLLQGYADAPPIAVHGIASDSRQLGEGSVFLACQGLGSHGLDYLEDALAAGVSAVVYDTASATQPDACDVPVIGVDCLSEKLGEIANRFYGRPSDALRVIGVTGTNGKTTVAWLVAQCAQRLGSRCAYLGTIGYGIDELESSDGMTTPPAIELHGRLAEFVEQDADYAAIEVSSHALAQHRVDGVRFEAALFTNLTRDHLDYHASMQDYFETKARLFLDSEARSRIIDIDTEFGAELAARCGQAAVVVSTQLDRAAIGQPHVFARSVVLNERGSDVSFVSSWGEGRFSLAPPGDFNVSNAVLVLALMLQQGASVAAACDALSQVQAPPGRMQRVGVTGPAVYVDYAHTPNALQAALRALRPHCRGKLWCVFGCGGMRDTGKRPIMAKTAEQLADRVVITSDNPRDEDPLAIIDDVVAGLSESDAATVIEDRAAAIAWAVEQADDIDVVLVAGKGHEDTQQLGDECRPFSDYAVARAVLVAATGEEQE